MSRLVLMFFIVPDYLSAGGAPDVRVNARPLVALVGGAEAVLVVGVVSCGPEAAEGGFSPSRGIPWLSRGSECSRTFRCRVRPVLSRI